MALIDREYFDKLPLGTTKQMQPFMESVDTFIQTASEQVEAYCERKFELQEHTEHIWGTGRNKLIVDQYDPSKESRTKTILGRHTPLIRTMFGSTLRVF
jgi:hypothetical protein